MAKHRARKKELAAAEKIRVQGLVEQLQALQMHRSSLELANTALQQQREKTCLSGADEQPKQTAEHMTGSSAQVRCHDVLQWAAFAWGQRHKHC